MVTLVVPNMDEGISHFTKDWGFSITTDTRHVSGHRWVEISAGSGARLRLVEAINDEQRSVIGRQAGGRVAFFLRIVGLEAAVERWAARGIEVLEPLRSESYGKVVVLRDKFGNRWDVLDAGSGD
jgi:uncharacterized glyoxalase superfamily protein PhnB